MVISRRIRSLLALGCCAAALWFTFAVPLGSQTLAGHLDTIARTPEAEQLVDDARGTIDPALTEVRDRIFGEYVEAPTSTGRSDDPERSFASQIPPAAASPSRSSWSTPGGDHDGSSRRRGRVRPEAGRSSMSASDGTSDAPNTEPRLPGRR